MSHTGATLENVEVVVEYDQVDDLNYCITTGASCKPNTLLNSKFYFEEEGIYRVCVTEPTAINANVVCSDKVIIDRTAPVINDPIINGMLGNNGWYTTDVEIIANGAIDLSGLQDITVDIDLMDTDAGDESIIIDYDTAGETVTITATDLAGNTSTKEITIKRDTVAPEIADFTLTGTLGLNSWFVSDVAISNVSATDALSGLASVDANSTLFTVETLGTDVIVTAYDNAGNMAQKIENIKIDKTAPVVSSYDITEKEADNEWHKTIVMIENIVATDSFSGIDTSTIGSLEYTIDYETIGENIEIRIQDLAGNVFTELIEVKVDLNAPTAGQIILDGTLGLDGWYNSDVTISTTEGSDNISGIKSSELNVHILTGVALETTVYLTTTDNAGHETLTEKDVKIDKIVPEVGTIVANGTLGLDGWYTSDVTIGKIDGSDSGSGHGSTTVDILEITDNTVGTIVTITTEDRSGLTASYSQTIKIDKIVPTITQNGDISIELGTSIDLTSKFTTTFGVSEGTITCSITDTSILEIGTYDLTCTVTSNAGLTSSVTTTIEVVDTYEELEYIESFGGQYINTGLLNTGDYIFEDEFFITSTDLTSTGFWLVGGRVNPNYSLGVFVNSSQIIGAYGTLTQTMYPKVSTNVWTTMYFSRFELNIGGTNYNLKGQTLIPEEYEGEIVLGGNQVAYDGVSKDNRNMIGKRKYFKVTDATTGELIRHYIPVRLNLTGEVGMWDLVEGKFYGNDGTGEFTGS